MDLITSTSTLLATVTSSADGGPLTVITSTSTNLITDTRSSATAAASAAATSDSAGLANPSNEGSTSSPDPKTIAVATVVPIVVVVLLVVAGIWFWRKRKDRRNAAEMRRKEMEEYGFNPNNDPTLPAGASSNGDEPSTMREQDGGYRGWGTTSTQRQPSTTMSSQPGMARSDDGGPIPGQPSPLLGVAQSDGHSSEPLVSPGSDDIGALGAAPTAANKRGAGVNRGPSNASSAYSGANYSDVSAEGPLPSGGPHEYGGYVHPDEAGPYNGAPVIRDVSARRNTRIEEPSVLPRPANSGIAQNF